MESQKKKVVLILFLYLFWFCFCFSRLEGETVINGKILIPGPVNRKEYKARFVLSSKGMEIKCQRKIFQPINEFYTPLKNTIFLPAESISRVDFDRTTVYILTNEEFYQRYRNIFHETYFGGWLINAGSRNFEMAMMIIVVPLTSKEKNLFLSICPRCLEK